MIFNRLNWHGKRENETMDADHEPNQDANKSIEHKSSDKVHFDRNTEEDNKQECLNATGEGKCMDVEVVKVVALGMETLFLIPTQDHILQACAILGIKGPKYKYKGRSMQLDRQIVEVGGFGNCLFNALSYIISGSQKWQHLIRRGIIEHMRSHRCKKIFFSGSRFLSKKISVRIFSQM